MIKENIQLTVIAMVHQKMDCVQLFPIKIGLTVQSHRYLRISPKISFHAMNLSGNLVKRIAIPKTKQIVYSNKLPIRGVGKELQL